MVDGWATQHLFVTSIGTYHVFLDLFGLDLTRVG
jgi:hypothetical protein